MYSYYEKYLKYKRKYLLLKGGSKDEDEDKNKCVGVSNCRTEDREEIIIKPSQSKLDISIPFFGYQCLSNGQINSYIINSLSSSNICINKYKIKSILSKDDSIKYILFDLIENQIYYNIRIKDICTKIREDLEQCSIVGLFYAHYDDHSGKAHIVWMKISKDTPVGPLISIYEILNDTDDSSQDLTREKKKYFTYYIELFIEAYEQYVNYKFKYNIIFSTDIIQPQMKVMKYLETYETGGDTKKILDKLDEISEKLTKKTFRRIVVIDNFILHEKLDYMKFIIGLSILKLIYGDTIFILYEILLSNNNTCKQILIESYNYNNTDLIYENISEIKVLYFILIICEFYNNIVNSCGTWIYIYIMYSFCNKKKPDIEIAKYLSNCEPIELIKLILSFQYYTINNYKEDQRKEDIHEKIITQCSSITTLKTLYENLKDELELKKILMSI